MSLMGSKYNSRVGNFLRYVKSNRPLLSSDTMELLDEDFREMSEEDEMFAFLDEKHRDVLGVHASLGSDKIDLSRLSSTTFGSVQSNYKHEYWTLFGVCDDMLIHVHVWRQTILPDVEKSERDVYWNNNYSLFCVYCKLKNVKTGDVQSIPVHIQRWSNGWSDSARWGITHKYVKIISELDNHLFPMLIDVKSESIRMSLRLDGVPIMHNVPDKSTGCLVCADGVGHKLYYYPHVTGTLKMNHQSSDHEFSGSWFHEWQSGLNPFGTYSSLFLRAVSVASQSIGRSVGLRNRVSWCQFVIHLRSRNVKIFLWFVQPFIGYNKWLRSTFSYELDMNSMIESKKNANVYRLMFSKFSDNDNHQLLECVVVRESNSNEEMQIVLRSSGSSIDSDSDDVDMLKLSSCGQYVENVSYFNAYVSTFDDVVLNADVDSRQDIAMYRYFPTRGVFPQANGRVKSSEKVVDGGRELEKTNVVMAWSLIMIPVVFILFTLSIVLIVWFKRPIK